MVVTNWGKSGLTLIWAGATEVPRYCGIGIGSAQVLASDTALVTPTGARVDFSTRDTSTVQSITYTHDFNSVYMSGVKLTEFGIFPASTGGSLYVREGLGSVTFDGSIELQIQTTLRLF